MTTAAARTAPAEDPAVSPDVERFWSIVDATVRLEADPKGQLQALHDALASLSPGEIERFEIAFDHELRRSYAWDLWGAAYVVHGGASDDEFEYFRCWLISKGRRTDGVFRPATRGRAIPRGTGHARKALSQALEAVRIGSLALKPRPQPGDLP